MKAISPHLRLCGAEPAGVGGRRHVFLRPDDASIVVKVNRAEWTDRNVRPVKRLTRWLFPASAQRDLRAEAHEAVRIARRADRMGIPNPLPRFYGIVPTDHGPATQHERIREPDGRIATVLRDAWHEAGPALVPALDTLMRRLHALGVVVTDLHDRNIVVTQEMGVPVCRMVDGYGDRAAIPVRTWLGVINERALDIRIARFGKRLGLRWDRRNRRFMPPD